MFDNETDAAEYAEYLNEIEAAHLEREQREEEDERAAMFAAIGNGYGGEAFA